MKVKIVYTDEVDEIELRIGKDNKHLNEIKNYLENIKECQLIFYKNDAEVYINVNEVLFFETEFNRISAHTSDNVYLVKYKLYELESLLPNFFKRVSKSTIVNKNMIYTINRNVTQPGIISFKNTHKKTYISRMYYKLLKEELK